MIRWGAARRRLLLSALVLVPPVALAIAASLSPAVAALFPPAAIVLAVVLAGAALWVGGRAAIRPPDLDRLSRALGAAEVGVWDYDIATGALFWDARMHQLYGVPPDGRPRVYADWADRLHPDDREEAEATFRDALESGRFVADFRLRLPDGTPRHIKGIGAVYHEANGASRIVGVNLDATEDMRRATALDSDRREAERVSRTKSRMLATMSHEIRTPMNGVIGMLDLMLRHDLAPEQRERATIACRSARQLLLLLNDTLDLSKLDANRVTLRPAPTDVGTLARDVAQLLSATAQERGITLSAEVASSVPAVLNVDPTRLRQILVNLVGNAVKFTESGGVYVTLDYARETDTLSVAVRDTGIGIPEAARSSLFQRFSQVDTPAGRARGGTGLGLAICKELVELMGGSIEVDSVPDLGSTFRFHVRAAPPSRDAPAPPTPAPFRAITHLPPVRPARILVAEDNATNQRVLSAFLALDGHEAEFVPDGLALVEQVEAAPYDLLIMDIQMPRMDGVSATRRVRALPGPVSGIPIIALTANTSSEERLSYIAAGMDFYLAKPIVSDDLRAVIAAALAGRAPNPANAPNRTQAPAANVGAAPHS